MGCVAWGRSSAVFPSGGRPAAGRSGGWVQMRRGLPLLGGLVSVIKRRFGGPHNSEAPVEAAGSRSPPRPQAKAAHPAAGGASMPELTSEAVLAALRGVTDPERGGDVVSLGMISGVVV